MSNYTVITNFLAKDALASGNPQKVGKGADIAAELNAIATAIATKFDPALIASTAQILFGNGSASAPSIAFNAYTGTGLYAAAANSLGFAANGVTAGNISSSGAWTIAQPSGGNINLSMSNSAGPGLLVSTTAPVGAGNWAVIAQGTSGAARDIFSAQQQGFSNGFTVKYDNTQMQYAFNSGNVVVNAPSSGTALYATAPSGGTAMSADSGAATSLATIALFASTATAQAWGLGMDGSSNFAIRDLHRNVTPLTITQQGEVLIANVTGGAPALSITASAAASQALTISGAALASATALMQLNAQNGAALGWLGVAASASLISTGASAGDLVLRADNGGIAFSPNAGASIVMRITPSNGIAGLGPVNTGMVDMTPDTSTFSAVFNGTGGTHTCTWVRVGKQALLTIPASANNGTTTLSFTGLPAALQPATLTQNIPINCLEGNGAQVHGCVTITAGSGTVTFQAVTASGGYTTAFGSGALLTSQITIPILLA